LFYCWEDCCREEVVVWGWWEEGERCFDWSWMLEVIGLLEEVEMSEI
jgi:hypothetical protein